MTQNPLLRVEGLSKHYVGSRSLGQRIAGVPRTVVKAVSDVSFEINKGEILGLIGESGCGKSTLGRAVLRLHEPTAGKVSFGDTDVTGLDAVDLKAMRRRMQIIFQDPYASLNPRWRVRDIIAEPIRAFGLLPDRAAQEARVAELLTQVGLSPLDGHKFPHEFSGGQRQRMSIARAISLRPEFVICDEAVSALDVSIQAQVINLLIALQHRHQLTYLFISHDLSVVRLISDDLMVMYLGRPVEQGAKEVIFENALSHIEVLEKMKENDL